VPRPSFNSETGTNAVRKSWVDGSRRPTPTTRSQAIDLQGALHEAGQSLRARIASCDDDRTRAQLASSLASVSKGWQAMTEQLRILSGKPAPGTLNESERARQREQQRAAKPRALPRAAPRASVLRELENEDPLPAEPSGR
jgi:hypothetical protein